MSTSATTATRRPRRTIRQGRDLIAAWQSSGLSAAAFCKARKMSGNRIDYWQRRLRILDNSKAAIASPAFIQLIPPDTIPPPLGLSHSRIEVTLPNGLRLGIQPGSDLPWTASIVAALLRVGTPC